MKRLLIALIIVSLLGFNSIAYAAEEGQTVDPGITPDSILYSADQLFEDLQLAFTTNSEKEAELLLKFAQERLAEAKEMTEEAKVEFVKTAMDAYIEALDKAEEKVIEVAAGENTTEEVKEELGQQLEATANVDESIQENLDTEQQEQVEEKITEVSYTANVVRNLDIEVVKTLREAGMGFGNIAHTIALSELSGKSVDEIASMMEEGKGVGNIAKELGLHPSNMNKKSEVAEEDTTEEETDEDTTAEEVAEETDENTTDNGETQATITQANNQDAAKVVESSSVKATSKKYDNKIAAESENKETTSIQQGDNTVKDNTSDDAEGKKDEIKAQVNQNDNQYKADNKEKSHSKDEVKGSKSKNENSGKSNK